MNAYRAIELADQSQLPARPSGFFRCQDCGRDTRNVQIHECEESDVRRRERRRPRSAKEDMIVMIRRHGANGSILALAKALADLGSEWRGDKGAAVGVECVTGYAPYRADDWRSAARCHECAACQEWMLTPDQAGPCMRRYTEAGPRR